MSKHTPGPWVVCEQDWRAVEGPDGLVVADVRAPLSSSCREDARLIAAAPELLEVSKLALAVLREQVRILDITPEPGSVIPQIEAAISKAEGHA